LISVDAKQGLSLGIGAAVAIIIIVVTFTFTREAIKATEKRELESALIQLLEPDSYNNFPSNDVVQLTSESLGSNKPNNIYRARKNGKPTGLVISATAPDGYNGSIDLLIGFNYSGDIVGVRVTSHKETPGLGDDIDISRSDWIRAFDNVSFANTKPENWRVKKDGGQFDQFTGATITPRAVVHSVYRVAKWYQEERDAIFLQ